MNDLDTLERFNLPGLATIDAGAGGLTRLTLHSAGATAQVYLHGAHVTGYTPAAGSALLFLSSSSLFAAGKAIRGGVPIIFPWFGPHPTDSKMPAHGFARTLPWTLRSVVQAANGVVAELSLEASDQTRRLWPHDFQLLYRITVTPASLRLELRVRNTGLQTFSFDEALHTYLAVEDVRQLKIEGLAGRPYLDKMQGGKRVIEGADPIVVTAETDRVYLDTPDTVLVREKSGDVIQVAKTNSLATVVWNPWIAKSKAMSDFGQDEWPRMLCIETANTADHAVNLAPASDHVMTATVDHLAPTI